jgi:hypothetical protein
MTQRSIATLSAIMLAALSSAAFAGSTTSSVGKSKIQVTPEIAKSCISGDLGFNVVSEYLSRGIPQENQGVVVQPYSDIYFRLYEGDGFLNKVQLNLGVWSSLHSENTFGTGTTRSWYEFDWTVGVSFTFLKDWTFTPTFVSNVSPNDAFQDYYGVNLNLSYDDTQLLGNWALHPFVNVEFELENKAGNGADQGVFYQFGVEPRWALGPVTASVPLTVAFGSNDFYTSNGFGYFSGGIKLAYPLAFVPECYGAWTLTSSALYYRLDQANDISRAITDSDEDRFVFGGGLVIAF